MTIPRYVIRFQDLRMSDVDRVGGKNASLGEMVSQLSDAGIRVPGGFATTSEAYNEFLSQSDLKQRIDQRLAGLDTDDVEALARCGAEIRQWIEATPFPPVLEAEIRAACDRMMQEEGEDISLAVRSSATAEDLPDASFAF